MTGQGRAPRLGFVGLGWIGRHRLEAVCRSGLAEVVVVADPDDGCRRAALDIAAGAAGERDLSGCLAHGIDGLVIATPSGMHAAQALEALGAGVAVFCQKPLARTAGETRAILDAAALVGRPLGVDFSYRHTRAIAAIADLARQGTLGDLYAASLTFHNAYGPDREWFYDPARSGGGCLIDLGSHLVDLALAFLPGRVTHVSSRLFRHGVRLMPPLDVTEDFAVVRCDFSSGALADVQCSWRLPAGDDCVFECTWYGTKGGARMFNVGGSFYDFVAERLDGTTRARLAEPPDDWGGRAVVDWVGRLAAGEGFDPAVAVRLEAGAEVIDRAYGRWTHRPAAGTRAQEVA